MLKDEEKLLELKQICKKYYNYVKFAYKHFSGNSGVKAFCITMNSLNEFVNKCQMIDNQNLKTSDIDLHYITTYSSSKAERNVVNPNRSLVRHEFMEFLVRCAKDKFLTQNSFLKEGKTQSLSEAMNLLFTQHIVPYCKSLNYNVLLIIILIKSFILLRTGDFKYIGLKRWIHCIRYSSPLCSISIQNTQGSLYLLEIQISCLSRN